jgi:CO/xanthine dehydrogenase FAD-binding subunit
MAMVGRTPMDAPIVVAAAVVVREGDHCQLARLALGGVAATPQRLTLLEQQLAGQVLSQEMIHVTAEQVGSMVQPAGDYRGSVEYRRMVAGVFSERVLQEAYDAA